MKKGIKHLLALSVILVLLLSTSLAYAGWDKPNPCNPCGKAMKNPCNPCAKMSKSYSAMVKKGKKLWNDEKLGKSGMSCMSCHADHESLNLDKVGDFPHYVAMPDRVVTLDQMINFCMVTPMETKPLPWDSVKMTAMATYYKEYVKSYKGARNPCSRMMNPCCNSGGTMMNPCDRMMKSPMMNPCNPCGHMMNPCNPCRK